MLVKRLIDEERNCLRDWLNQPSTPPFWKAVGCPAGSAASLTRWRTMLLSSSFPPDCYELDVLLGQFTQVSSRVQAPPTPLSPSSATRLPAINARLSLPPNTTASYDCLRFLDIDQITICLEMGTRLWESRAREGLKGAGCQWTGPRANLLEPRDGSQGLLVRLFVAVRSSQFKYSKH